MKHDGTTAQRRYRNGQHYQSGTEPSTRDSPVSTSHTGVAVQRLPETLDRCRFPAGPALQTLDQQQNNNCPSSVYAGVQNGPFQKPFPFKGFHSFEWKELLNRNLEGGLLEMSDLVCCVKSATYISRHN